MPSPNVSVRRYKPAWFFLGCATVAVFVGCQVTVEHPSDDVGVGGSGGEDVAGGAGGTDGVGGGDGGSGGSGDSCDPFPQGATECFQEGLNCTSGVTTCPCDQMCSGTSCTCTNGMWGCYTWDLVGPPCDSGGGGEGGGS